MEGKIVVVGTSLGGLQALGVILAGLPAQFSWPIVIVQHRHKDAGDTLRVVLQRTSRLPIVEPCDKDSITARNVYLAPADYHLLIDGEHFALSTEGPVSYARPSIDVLFESAADAYMQGVIGVLLTGANHDGAHGVAAIKAQGGRVLIQDPASAVCAVMPQAGIAATEADWILPLEGIAPWLVRLAAARFSTRPLAHEALNEHHLAE